MINPTKLPRKGQMIFSTKHALTSGIEEVKVDSVTPGEYVYYLMKGGPSYGVQLPKSHWFFTRKEALQKTLTMILQKRKSLKKSMDKLEELRQQVTKELNA